MKTLLFFLLLPVYANSQTISPEKIYKKVSDAVIKIYATDNKKEAKGQASGIIIRNRAWIITNYHILNVGAFITTQHNDKTYEIDSVVSMDPEKDILIFQMKDAEKIKKDKTIPQIQIGNSAKLNVGQKIYAIGSPMGFENTMTEGIVSGLRTADDSAKNLIQISAPISPGSSGGAILNDKGELVGISCGVITTAQNLNFAIPINDVMATVPGTNVGRGDPETFLTGSSLAEYDYNKGVNAYMTRKYDSSIIYFRHSLNKSAKTKRPQIYYCLGVVHQFSARPDSALYYFEKTIEIAPNFAEPYLSLFEIYAAKGDLQKAVQYQYKAYQLKPDMRHHKTMNFKMLPPY